MNKFTHVVLSIKQEDYAKVQELLLNESISFTVLDPDNKWEFQQVMDDHYESSYESSYDTSGC
jgi:hypothetical protein